MKLQQSQKQEMSFVKKAAFLGGTSLIVALIAFAGIKLSNVNDAKAGNDYEVKGTSKTISSGNYDEIKVEDGGTLIITGAVRVSDKVEIKKKSKIEIKVGGSLTMDELKIEEESSLIVDGTIDVSDKIEVKKKSTFSLAAGSDFTLNDEFKVEEECTVTINSNITVNDKVEIKKESNFSLGKGAVFIVKDEFKIEEYVVLNLNGKLEMKDKAELKKYSTINVSEGGEFVHSGGEEIVLKEEVVLNVKNLGEARFTNKKLKVEHSRTKVNIEPGGWMFVKEMEVKNSSSFVNNGYLEHTSNSKKLKFDGVSMTGNGVFYCLKKSKLDLKNNAKLFGKTKNQHSNDHFSVGSNKIAVKRLPKFKIEEDNWELSDTLVVKDTIDLNGKSLDIKDKDFRLPKSFSFNRSGDNSEYIKTSSSGRYKLSMLKNDKVHTAPIGRNPYLPVEAECEDCEGTEFAVAVTENVYLDPVLKTGQQNSSAVGETWSVIPDKNVSGSVTFEFQWNAGANGTTSSELSGFNRSGATSYYWIVGQSSQWQNDGTNVNIAVTGSDPYTMQVTFNGMTQGKEYLFSVGSAGTALPVEFTYFDAKSMGDKIELTWGTATETNNDFFEVQRSQDGVNWDALEEVNGAGTTLEAQDYTTYDYYPLDGLTYYRLRQVDFDGTQDYSEVRKIESSSANANELLITSIYPNPFRSMLTVDIDGLAFDNFKIELLNSSGVVVKEREFGAGENAQLSNLDDLQFGVYFLRVIQSEKIVTQQVIKR
ncbi:MAG: T9SS type A sorting domain-containing protein [Bacteroidia bacterium]